MGKIILLAVILCSQLALGFSSARLASDKGTLSGPEAFQFCGGWVELWAQPKLYETTLYLKASPPAKVKWRIWNAHIVPEFASQPVKLKDVVDEEIPNGSTNVLSWNISLEGTGDIKVALKPFDGCPASTPIRGVVLKSN